MLAPAPSGTSRWVVDIADATDPALCGGKAAGLAALAQTGWAVPAALCVTTAFYRRWLEASRVTPEPAALSAAATDPAARRQLLDDVRARIHAATLPEELEVVLRDAVGRLHERRRDPLAVRSSGVHEDGRSASHAGIHASFVVAGDDLVAVITAIKTSWASLWTEAAWAYRERLGLPHDGAAMAVVIQRFVPAVCSGVVFSADPLTGDRGTVVIEAGWGTGAALVGGKITPDEYRVSLAAATPAVTARRTGRQTTQTVWRDGRETALPLDEARRRRSVLDDAQALELARAVKRVETAHGAPMDVEWVNDGTTLWAVQARPITTLERAPAARPPTLWTRANLKEVFPDLPSPLALSYLAISLNRMFRSYHASHGYALPPGANLVSVIRGRPYLNLSLMQDLAIERGGDPAVVGRLFGGGQPSSGRAPAPAAPSGLSLVAQARLAREMLATFFRTPRRGRRLFRRLRREAAELAVLPVGALSDRALIAHLERFGRTLLAESSLRRIHEVVSAQSRAYMVLEALLNAWIPTDADTLLKRLMTGLGTLPNVRMTYALMNLAAVAARTPRARAYFTGDLDEAALRDWDKRLAGTGVLTSLQRFLKHFGHRGSYESDVMSARFGEDPAPVLRLIQLHVRAGGTETAARHAAERRRVRREAMAEVKQALRRGRGWIAFALQWTVFSVVCSALQRLLALRDECRHVTTMLVGHLRKLALEIGRRGARAGTLAAPADVFFTAWDELPRVLTEPGRGWGERAAERR
ncbi:MAG TPA: PEP/pyruvate-binding domain-containing protein, partial [Methylomirabilota bacterium]|nr:PEP/pyruvate-binding domain-containing protein [Methylomirabilota bacterium]